jgi:hypothetical protein
MTELWWKTAYKLRCWAMCNRHYRLYRFILFHTPPERLSQEWQ